jgi:hypothetical protein
MARLLTGLFLGLAVGCNCLTAQPPADGGADAGALATACTPNPCFQGGACEAAGTDFTCAPCPTGFAGDGVTCADVDGCAEGPCFSGVACTDVPAPGVGFACGACPSGMEGTGVTCVDIDGCADAPCLATTTCTDVPAPDAGYTCSACTDAGCPTLRALAGPDQLVVRGTAATLTGSAVGANGAISCAWTGEPDGGGLTGCAPSVTPAVDTEYELTVTDRSARTAVDRVVVRVAELLASAGPDSNVTSGQSATLRASWSGASCGADAGCVDCQWRESDGGVAASTCTAQVSPLDTTQYFLTVTDTEAGASATDSATVFVTDRPAQLCGWNVVVMTSDEYPTAANPNYLCDPSGTARRQTINGKPAIVLSDLVVEDVRITGFMSVETTSDDDLIGFLWGWQNPKQAYLLTWKQLSQNWTARCGNAPAGIAIKKLDGALAAPATISFNASFGYSATDYIYSCADAWSQSRANASLLKDDTLFLLAPGDPGSHAVGWRDSLTYRFEFFYTPMRTRIVVYEDDLMTGSTDTWVTTLTVDDSSYPSGAFAFFSNSQEQVAFGDFTLASLSGYQADAGPDQAVGAGQAAALNGGAVLAVPPFTCAWTAGGAAVASTCQASLSPGATTTYTLTVTDGFGRVATDAVEVRVTP